MCVWAGGGFAQERRIDEFVQRLTDEDWSVRLEAVKVLGETGDALAVEPLMRTLKDEDSGAGWAAVQALAKIGAAAVDPLI